MTLKTLSGSAFALAALSCLPMALAAAADSPGLQPGAQAPSFALQDQNGKTRSLADLLKKGPVALVFHRSADW